MLKSHAMLVTKIQQELEERYYSKDVVKFSGRRNRRFPISPASVNKEWGVTIHLPALRKLSISTIVEIIEQELLYQTYIVEIIEQELLHQTYAEIKKFEGCSGY